MLLRESKNIVCRNAIDNFRRGQTIDLLFKDVFQPLLGVRECGFHTLALIQALHDFGNVQTRFHVQVNEGLVRVVKAAGIFFFQKRYHLGNSCFRRKDLVCALRRDVVEDVLLICRVKIVCQLMFQPQELFDGIIEYDFIKQLSVKVLCLACGGILVIAAIAQETELLQRDAGDFLENFIWNDLVEVGKGGILCAVGHQERWNRAGKTAQMVADGILHIVLLALLDLRLIAADSLFGGILHETADRIIQSGFQLFSSLSLFLVELLIDFFLLMGCGSSQLFMAFFFDLVSFDTIVAVSPRHQTVRILAQLLLYTLGIRSLDFRTVIGGRSGNDRFDRLRLESLL